MDLRGLVLQGLYSSSLSPSQGLIYITLTFALELKRDDRELLLFPLPRFQVSIILPLLGCMRSQGLVHVRKTFTQLSHSPPGNLLRELSNESSP